MRHERKFERQDINQLNSDIELAKRLYLLKATRHYHSPTYFQHQAGISADWIYEFLVIDTLKDWSISLTRIYTSEFSGILLIRG